MYVKYFGYIDLKHIKDTYKELHYLYLSLIKLHEKTEGNLSVQDLEAFFFVLYPDADKDTYSMFFKQLYETEITEEVGEVLLSEIKRRKQALSLSESLFKISQGIEVDHLAEQWESLNEPSTKTTQELSVVSTDLEQLLETTYQKQGFRWRLSCLNKSLGSLRKGDFGFIFARPETGKTTFLASEVSHFIQNGAKVVWINNEEDNNKVMLRVIQAYFGCSLAQLLSNVKKYRNEFLEASDGKFIFPKLEAGFGKKEVEKIIDIYKPDITVYDQLDKINGFSADREDLVLGKKYQWARELAKDNHAAIGVSQADGTAEGVRYLTMEHTANAKTAKQAEADFVLGIGRDRDPALEMVRYFALSKNKMLGDEDSIPELRHGRFETLINPYIARYEDTIEYK